MDLGHHGETFLGTKNVPRLIAFVLTMERPQVTLHELQTVYSLEDVYKLIEVGMVDAHNARLVAKRQQEEMRRLQMLQGG